MGYALAMHHIPGPGDTHWYWVVYDIPPTTLSVDAGATNFGTFGTNSVNDERVYAPPCSKGPGEKLYTITVYALSAVPNLPDPAAVDRDTLLAAIADITLASASMDVTYERGQAEGAAPGPVEEAIQPAAGGRLIATRKACLLPTPIWSMFRAMSLICMLKPKPASPTMR